MGQQQLLLIILVTLVVGIATVVAVSTFSSAAESAMLDAVRQDMASIAAAAQGYYMKPEMLGGGGNSFTGITFRRMAFTAGEMSNEEKTTENGNGVYTITSAAGNEMEITGAVPDGKTELHALIGPDSYELTNSSR